MVFNMQKTQLNDLVIEQNSSIGRDLQDHEIQLPDHFRAKQKLKHIIKGLLDYWIIIQMVH